jgi:putative acetyltransferase
VTTDPLIRPIRPEDDPAMAAIIREVMTSFGAYGPGYSINDPEVDAMSAHYPEPRAVFFVVEHGGSVLGGGGIGPLAGSSPDTCELRKMYFLPELRGRGFGEKMLQRCLAAARERGYRRCYLETLTHMEAAQRLYAKAGFTRLPGAIGATGHSGCNRFFVLAL